VTTKHARMSEPNTLDAATKNIPVHFLGLLLLMILLSFTSDAALSLSPLLGATFIYHIVR
jgi:hypothetical protein